MLLPRFVTPSARDGVMSTNYEGGTRFFLHDVNEPKVFKCRIIQFTWIVESLESKNHAHSPINLVGHKAYGSFSNREAIHAG